MSVWDMFGGSPGFGSGDPDNTNPADTSFNSSAISGGVGLAGLGIGAGGTAMSLMSGLQASSDEAAGYVNQENIAGLEMKVNAQRKQQMELTAERQSMENLRNTQKAKALGLAAATNQGAQFGSGLAGAQGSQTAEGALNQLGIGQNLSIGRNIFSLDDQISQQKIQYAQNLSAANTAKGQASLWSGIGSLGMDLLKAAPMIAAL